MVSVLVPGAPSRLRTKDLIVTRYWDLEVSRVGLGTQAGPRGAAADLGQRPA